MAKKPDGKSAGVDRVSFTRQAADRIGKVVRQVEGGDRDLGPVEWGPRGGGASGKVFRVCTFTGSWAINTDKTVTFRGVTTTPNTVTARNLIVSLPAPKSQGASRVVNIAKDGTQWYLVSFEVATATAVLASATQTITYIGSGGTQTITYATPGSSVAAITGVSASLNTSNCSIAVSVATTSIQTVGSTQTATTMSAGSTQTAVIVTGTATATYVTLEI